MTKDSKLHSSQQYQLVEKAIHYLAERHTSQPTLAEVAEHVGLSEFYFQRLFSEWAGISPKRFLQYLNKEYIKSLLAKGHSSLNAGYQAGLSGPGRMHELFINTEAISPAEYKSMGKNLTIDYGFHSSPFGEYLLATTNKGICHLNFLQNDKAEIEKQFKAEWSLAAIQRDQEKTLTTHLKLFTQPKDSECSISLLLKGTNFQIQVWQALLQIPLGSVCHYQHLASDINKPKAARATASSIARNKIGYLIPCHRVVRKVGESGEYRWGKERKKLMLAYEASVIDNTP
jgi:AraC family transcriptional regulator, regulatory protein of adaptative response / methylated-DNA-[protein]-cysteine methyltransferase